VTTVASCSGEQLPEPQGLVLVGEEDFCFDPAKYLMG
jgi:hypothetical protein